MTYDLSRFIDAHKSYYDTALAEIKNGKKESHWIWYIFPQMKGLGFSYNSDYYGILNLDEAKEFLKNDYLASHLKEISSALLDINCDDIKQIMDRPDDLKLKSSMTLFMLADPDEPVFRKVLEKFFGGKQDRKTLKILGFQVESPEENTSYDRSERIISIQDDNIQALREKYPEGLHFVVGDTHGEAYTLYLLMKKIAFNPEKDHVYFVGDYNAGGNVNELLGYIANYYQEDFSIPGFHLIRGNHERSLVPTYSLDNLPDIMVIRGKAMNYFIAHAGMVSSAFDLINKDINSSPNKNTYAYSLTEESAGYRAPLNNITWSSRGLYSQKSYLHLWPSEDSLHDAHACIIHGHTPFSMLKRGNHFSYGDINLFWENQKIWFAEDLQSFNIDSNVKGRYNEEDNYRGLSCVCLECIDEIAMKNDGIIKRDAINESENFVFSVRHTYGFESFPIGDLYRVINSSPESKTIGLDAYNQPQIL